MNSMKLTTPHVNNNYIIGIDGLRALAVLAVIIFHMNPLYLPGGYTGVDVFFVISGYVVCASLSKGSTANLASFITKFYARRVIRIFPALIVCLVVVSILVTLFVPASWLSKTNEYTGLYAFFGVSNFALVWLNDGYFSPRVEFNPFTHTWSLAVEEQFYLFFPFVIFLWLKFKNKDNYLGYIAEYLLPILLISSLIFSFYETSQSPERAFYLLPSRFWELACGAFLCKLHIQKKLLLHSIFAQRLALLAGIICLVGSFVFSDDEAFPFPWAILSVLSAILLILCVVNNNTNKTMLQKILESKLLVYIGKRSYSLYLWHWPVYVLLRWTIGFESLFHMILGFILSLVLANLSYHFIETPIRKHSFILKSPNWKVVTSGLIIITVTCSFSWLVFKSQTTTSLSVTKLQRTWYPYAWNPADMIKDVKEPFKGRTLHVLGDSHTGAYSTMLKIISVEYGVQVKKYVAEGCGVVNLLRPSLVKGTRCSQIVERQLDEIQTNIKAGDILFLASLRMHRLGDQWTTFSDKKIFDSHSSEKAQRNTIDALQEAVHLIEIFEKLNVHIIIDAPKPVFKSPLYRCSDWFNRSNPICKGGTTIGRDFLIEYREPVMVSLNSLKLKFPKLIIWDPFPILCEKEICSALDGEKPLFFDGDHLSADGNRKLYPSFSSLISHIWR
jgi:peptidoglycan/LPS O-acetylase OafA/YrhL